MNVLTIAHLRPDKVGNFERTCVSFSRFLQSRGHTHHICFLQAPIDAVATPLDEAGAKVYVMDFGGMGMGRTMFLARFIRENHIDVVHMHFYPIYTMFSMLVRFMRARYYISYHISGTPVRRPWFIRWLKRVRSVVMGMGIDGFICVSRFNEMKLLNDYQESRSKSRVVYHGIDMAEFDALSKNRDRERRSVIQVICVAYLRREKGVQHLIEAVPAIINGASSCRFAIVGDGPYREDLEHLARELDVTRNVGFLGTRNDVPELLIDSDIAVVPSIWGEAAGYVVLEAMAAGLPVVATDAGGIPEVVEDGVNGIIVGKSDTSALSSAIRRLVMDAGLRERMGRASIEKIRKKYLMERVCHDFLKIYEAG